MAAIIPGCFGITHPQLLKNRSFYYIDRTTTVHRLAIPPVVATKVIITTYDKGQPRFSRCYKIISHFQYIYDLIKLLKTFIYQSLLCLAL